MTECARAIKARAPVLGHAELELGEGQIAAAHVRRRRRDDLLRRQHGLCSSLDPVRNGVPQYTPAHAMVSVTMQQRLMSMTGVILRRSQQICIFTRGLTACCACIVPAVLTQLAGSERAALSPGGTRCSRAAVPGPAGPPRTASASPAAARLAGIRTAGVCLPDPSEVAEGPEAGLGGEP